MPISITQLDQQLRSGQPGPVYVLLGAEAFLRHSAIERLAAAMGEGGRALQPTRLDAAQVGPAEAVDAARSLQLFTPRQLLVVGDVGAWGADGHGHLTAYLAAPNPATTLVLWAAKLDQRTKAAQALTQGAIVLECKPLYADRVPEWVRIECQRQGRAISREAAGLLADAVGTELGAVHQAIAKVFLYTEGKRLIGVEDVEAVVLQTSERSIFELCNAVGQRDRLGAIRLLERLLAHGEPPVMIAVMLARHWRLLLRARELAPGADVGRALKVHPFFAKDYAGQAAGFGLEELQRGFAVLADTDRALKRSRVPGRVVLSYTIMQLVSGLPGSGATHTARPAASG